MHKVTASTLGNSGPSLHELSGGYHYNKDPDWVAGDPRYYEADTRKVPNPAGGTPPDSAARKRKRIARFKEALADISGTEPRFASSAAIREAARRIGVGEKTARTYWKTLLLEGESRDA